MIFLLLNAVISISGVWNAWGYNSGDWNELAPLLADNGYDTVFYCAAYGLETDIDGLIECIDACNQYDIDVNAWVVCWKTSQSSHADQALFADENRLQISTDGDSRVQTWLCPSDPINVAALAEVCLNIAATTNIKGIHLDYIRYASNRTCFCSGCRSRFQNDLNISRLDWPEDCASGGSLYQEYNNWRSETITAAVGAVRDSLDKLNKIVELSAAILPQEREMNYYAQHWNRWLSSGLVDFVVPMNYTVSNSELISWGENQLELAGRNSIPCGLITSKDSDMYTEREITEQQRTAIRMGFDGWVMFHLSEHLISILEGNTRQ